MSAEVVVRDERSTSLEELSRLDHVHSLNGTCVRNRFGPPCGSAPALTPAELAEVRRFQLDQPEDARLAQAVRLLREQEAASRRAVAALRETYDSAPAGSVYARVIKEEARAGAFASAVEIVEGMAL